MGSKQAITPNALAQILWDSYIVAETCSSIVEKESPSYSLFEAKTTLYRMSASLLAVLFVEQNDSGVLELRVELEKRIFPMPQHEGVDILHAVREAMTDLKNLLYPSEPRKEFAWAKNWFAGIGITENNPATLFLLSQNWTEYYITMVKIIQDVSLRFDLEGAKI